MPAKRKYRKRRKNRPRRSLTSLNKMRANLSNSANLNCNTDGLVECSVAMRSMTNSFIDSNGQITSLIGINALSSLFDLYRVLSIKITYDPAFVEGYSPAFPSFYRSLLVAMDYDGVNTDIPTVNQMQNKQRCKRFDLKKPWTYNVKVPKYQQTGTNNTAAPLGWQLVDEEENNINGTVYLLSAGVIDKTDANSVNTPFVGNIGTLSLEYIVEFKGRANQ